MFFANLKIGKRLALGFALVLMFSIVIAAIGIWRLRAVSVETHAMMDHPLTKERLISDWYTNLATGILRTTAIAKSSDPALAPYFSEGAIAGSKSSGELQKQIEALISTDRERALFQKIGDYRKAYLVARDRIDVAKKAGNIEEVNRLLDQQFVPASNAYQDQMRQLLDLQRQDIDRMARQVDAVADDSLVLVSALECLALLLGALCAWYLTRGITRPIDIAVQVARTVAGGDLTSRITVTSRDQTGQLMQSLKDMNDNLLGVVGQVRSGTDTIAAATTQIAAGNLDLSSRTEQQAASLEETASSMEQLTSTVKQNADNARQANQLAVSASEVAVKGGAVVSQVVETMDSINQSSRRIVDIISVIDGIAFQTNILALNAAVEAARAGEQGRGFAVVASEVRNLAQRSAAAAKEIKGLIDDSVSKTDAGTRLVGQAGVTMDEVVHSIRRVTDVMSEITAASQEQTLGIEQVNQAMVQMDAVTQQNAALVEQAAAAAASLQDQAAHLSQVVGVFTLAHLPASASASASASVSSAALARVQAGIPARINSTASTALPAPK